MLDQDCCVVSALTSCVDMGTEMVPQKYMRAVTAEQTTLIRPWTGSTDHWRCFNGLIAHLSNNALYKLGRHVV